MLLQSLLLFLRTLVDTAMQGYCGVRTMKQATASIGSAATVGSFGIPTRHRWWNMDKAYGNLGNRYSIVGRLPGIASHPSFGVILVRMVLLSVTRAGTPCNWNSRERSRGLRKGVAPFVLGWRLMERMEYHYPGKRFIPLGTISRKKSRPTCGGMSSNSKATVLAAAGVNPC